jgi:hypothetical protein
MRVAAIMVGMLVSLVFAKKLAGEETNRQKEMRFDDQHVLSVQHVTNGLSESRSPFFLCALGSGMLGVGCWTHIVLLSYPVVLSSF